MVGHTSRHSAYADLSNKELVWYFTMSYDTLEYWNGTDVDVTTINNNLPYIDVE